MFTKCDGYDELAVTPFQGSGEQRKTALKRRQRGDTSPRLERIAYDERAAQRDANVQLDASVDESRQRKREYDLYVFHDAE